MKKIKTCVIGVGGMGTNHCRVLRDISTLVGVFDVNVDRAKTVAKTFGTKHFESINTMIEETQTDCVTVAVNTQHHKKVALEIIKHGVPLLVEKPIAHTPKDAKKIIEAARSKNIFLMAGMVERYNPTTIKLKSDIDKRVFGEIYQIVAMRVGIAPPNMSPRSVDIDLSIHDVDIINYLIGSRPIISRISGHGYLNGSQKDTCSLLLTYQNTTASVISNWVSPVKIRKLFIFGEKMSAEVDMLNQHIYYYSKISPKLISKSNYFLSFQKLGAHSRHVSFQKSEPLLDEMKVFLKMIKGGYKGEYCESSYDALKIISQAKKK